MLARRDAHPIGATEQRFQVSQHIGRNHVAQRQVYERCGTEVFTAVKEEHPREGGVRQRHVACGVD